MDEDWREQRTAAAEEQAARAARRRADDVAQAQVLVDAFVAEAASRGLATSELLVRGGDSRDVYRCGLVGWYLRRDGSLAVTEDARMFVLTAPRSLLSRLRGVSIEPIEPRLQAGIGARDGESIALDALLAMRLAAGDDWPVLR